MMNPRSQEPQPWQQLHSRVVFDHPRLSLVEDTVVLPTGRQTEWLRFQDRPDFVLVICVDAARRILLSRQYCHPVGRVVHEFPGGLVDVGESYIEAARRELMEEVGWYAHQLDEIGTFLPHVRRSSARARLYVATELEERHLPADSEEFIAYEWVDVATLEARMRSGELDNGHLHAAWNVFRLHAERFLA
jgi:ADP-ribose pyrophosphatase